MGPRFIMKTHTGALRPGNYSVLISKCTYPYKGSSPETVTKKLGIILENNPKSSIAKFSILTAGRKNRGFGFLLDNMVWSWKAHVINTVLSYLKKAKQDNVHLFFELDKLEKITYLRYFLETEGALILKIAREINEKGVIRYSYLEENIQKIFQEIYEEYLGISDNLRVRLEIRKKLKELFKKYKKSTLPHKIKPHIQALKEIGILCIEIEDNNEIYKSAIYNNSLTLSNLFKSLIDIQHMEEVFSNYAYFELIANIFNLKVARYNPHAHKELVKDTIFYGYSIMKDEITNMASIDALVDWCCIKMLSVNSVFLKKDDVIKFLDDMRKVDSSNIRYHVDGKGRIAYLILSEPSGG